MEMNIKGGVYLVLDPSGDQDTLQEKLRKALKGGVAVIQIWNHWTEKTEKASFIEKVCREAAPFGVPVLIHEDWRLLEQNPGLAGVHFDELPVTMDEIRQTVGRPFLCGVTAGNDLETVHRADDLQFDYVSFCSMFPSASAGECTLVMPEKVRDAGKITGMPRFVSGGITPEKILVLKQKTDFEGVAVISGIMKKPDPEQAVKDYLKALKS